jgi:hypothetical protein
MTCILDSGSTSIAVLGIIGKEIESNYLMPSMLIAILLIYRMSQALTYQQEKKE